MGMGNLRVMTFFTALNRIDVWQASGDVFWLKKVICCFRTILVDSQDAVTKKLFFIEWDITIFLAVFELFSFSAFFDSQSFLFFLQLSCRILQNTALYQQVVFVCASEPALSFSNREHIQRVGNVCSSVTRQLTAHVRPLLYRDRRPNEGHELIETGRTKAIGCAMT